MTLDHDHGTAIMPRVQSFPPLAHSNARILILGSMPGEASLRAGEYYAHPRNAFWPIMGQLLGFDPDMEYAHRVERLTRAGIAVWDVLASCQRVGSLDSAIDDSTSTVNDFLTFVQDHRQLRKVFFNGGKARASFFRKVPAHPLIQDALSFKLLPSTSPANASFSREKIQQAWGTILDALPPDVV